MTLANTSQSRFEQNNLNYIIKTIFPLIQSDAIKDNKTVVLELNEIPDILLNTKEIKQLIFNISRNGLEAMDERGYLIIRTYKKTDVIVLEFVDKGTGIPPEILDKIGTPFLTNKINGNGLGLPVCYRIAAEHNASIQIDTSSQGTTFTIKFKLINKD